MEQQTQTPQPIQQEQSPNKISKILKNKKIILPIVAVLVLGIVAAAFLLKSGGNEQKNQQAARQTETASADDSSYYTGVQADVLTNQTFDCAARNDHEWYRTDRTLVVDYTNPNIMYVSVEYKGVFKTTDGGKTWAQKTKGIKVYARSDDKTKGCYSEYPVIRMDPKDPKHLVIGLSGGGGGFLDATTPNSQTGGVYQTFDGGEKWQLMINNKMNIYVTDVAIDPTSPNTVYYGTASNPASWQGADQNRIFVTKGLIYQTLNTGKSWQELPTGIGKHSSVSALLVNQANPKEIVAPTFSADRQSADGTGTGVSSGKDTSVGQLGILHSTDGGATWSKFAAQLPGNPAIMTGFSAPKAFNHMYFIPMGTTGQPTAYVTLDGKSFTATKYVDVVAYDPFDSTGNHAYGYSTINVGPASQNLFLWETTDGGLTWKKAGPLPQEIKDVNNSKTKVSNIVWHLTDPNSFYMSGAGGYVWKTTDRGQTWTALLDYTRLPK